MKIMNTDKLFIRDVIAYFANYLQTYFKPENFDSGK